MKVRFTSRARAHLDTIFGHVARDNPVAAREIVATIESLASALEEHQRLGHPTRIPGVRILTVPSLPYRISYEIGRNEVRILAIRHTSRRPLRTAR
jgi:addiction module RelE/StbE family toxin